MLSFNDLILKSVFIMPSNDELSYPVLELLVNNKPKKGEQRSHIFTTPLSDGKVDDLLISFLCLRETLQLRRVSKAFYDLISQDGRWKPHMKLSAFSNWFYKRQLNYIMKSD